MEQVSSIVAIYCPLLFGVALCRRLGLGQPASLGQDLQSALRQLVFVGLEQLGCCLQNPGRLALQPSLFQDPGDFALIGLQDRLENVIFQCSVLLHQEVLLPVRPTRDERDEIDLHLTQIEFLGHANRAPRC